MTAEVRMIKPDIDATAQTMLGMLNGYGHRMKHIAAVVVWDDGTSQLIHSGMLKSELAWLLAIFQKQFFEEIE